MVIRLDFHHIGLACHDLDRERSEHRLLGFREDGEPFCDPLQRVSGCFMLQGALRIELLAPTAEDSPLRPFLRRGIKMYHQAFTTGSLHEEIARLDAAGAICCSSPRPAVAFGGRNVAFMLLRSGMLVELIDREL